MDKNNRKKPHDTVRAAAIKSTARHFQVTPEYVRAAINGTAKGGRVDEIQKIFNEKYQAVKTALA